MTTKCKTCYYLWQNLKINGNESLQNISAPQYTFISHRPLKTGFNHNIYGYKGPETKIQAKKGPKMTKK